MNGVAVKQWGYPRTQNPMPKQSGDWWQAVKVSPPVTIPCYAMRKEVQKDAPPYR